MKNKIKAVEEFHKAFNSPIATSKTSIPKDRQDLRFNLMDEENKEYLEAAQNNDLVEVADALGDMLYILCGTIIEHGMQHKIEEVFNEIQRSNMSKLGADGKPIYREDGKVLKGPNYFKPNIEEILERDDIQTYMSEAGLTPLETPNGVYFRKEEVYNLIQDYDRNKSNNS